ncbi:MAG: MOSC domain-containing protein [bacterium]|nr:MOSC domain-containing protein [bacterium]
MTLTGMLTGIFIASDVNSLVSNRVSMVKVLENGFEGDKHQGWFRNADVKARRYAKGTKIWNSRQISIVAEEELALAAKDLGIGKIEPEWLGANICISGILDFSLLSPGTKIFIPNENGCPEVGLYITASNKPCIGPGKVIQSHYPQISRLDLRFVKAVLNKRGVVAVVEHEGHIKEYSPVSIVIQ